MKGKSRILIIVIIMALISFMSLSLSVSYSYITSSKIGNNTVKLSTGNLDATVTYTSLSNMEFEFLSDADGLNQTNYSTIEINKTHPYTVFYYINIGYSQVVNDLLPMEDLKVALYSVDSSNNLSANPVVGPVTIGDLPVFSASNATYSDALYTLFYGIFSSGTTSAKYAIKVWGNEDSASLYDEMSVNIGASITQYPLLNKSFYNVSGTVTDGSSPVAGAIVSLQNGEITSITDASGNYTLTNVPTGTWNLDVTSNENKYSTMLRIEGGSAVAFQAIGSNNSNTGASDSYLQASAYTYYSTPYKILKYEANSALTNSSNEVASASYVIPPAYKITGLDSLSVTNITGINMTINSDYTLTLSKAS